ncbi:trace amine-associated receptor 1-like [Poeciliopsis prolifica]|uniref:trace amine-associated receptor 1-like n=1 Tax=Poeciliopsis prolifica TaxID=188132 RepID=UPI002413A55F|nr:trace amine-associated receptor 1-like [Poeciliopsis prolifica]
MVEDQRLCNESAQLHGQTVTSSVFHAFVVSLSLLIICGNLLVIISVVYFKQLHTPTNYLILSLAVTDLLVGALVLPFSTILSLSSCSSSSYLLYRYFAVCHPLTYRSKMNVCVILTMILVSWTLSALFAVVIIARGINQENLSRRCNLFTATKQFSPETIFQFYIPAIIILSIYLKIFMVAKKQARQIQNTMKSEAALSKMEKKANKTLATVMGVFLICWTPFFLSIGFYSLGIVTIPVAAIEGFKWLGWSNSMLNPLVYAFFYRWFRRAFTMITSGQVFQGDFSNTKLL